MKMHLRDFTIYIPENTTKESMFIKNKEDDLNKFETKSPKKGKKEV